MCYELMNGFLIQAADLQYDEMQTHKYFFDVFTFVFLHELGHALVHVLDLPITGKEEDVVDQLAVVMILADEDDEDDKEFKERIFRVNSAAIWFELKMQEGYGHESYAGVHSLNAQRFHNLLCWMYGSDPANLEEFVYGMG